MPYRVVGSKGKTLEDTIFEVAHTETAAWDKAIDAWKGVPTANRPKFRWRALEAMIRNGYHVEAVR